MLTLKLKHLNRVNGCRFFVGSWLRLGGHDFAVSGLTQDRGIGEGTGGLGR
jgi:hypothetical protein